MPGVRSRSWSRPAEPGSRSEKEQSDSDVVASTGGEHAQVACGKTKKVSNCLALFVSHYNHVFVYIFVLYDR